MTNCLSSFSPRFFIRLPVAQNPVFHVLRSTSALICQDILHTIWSFPHTQTQASTRCTHRFKRTCTVYTHARRIYSTYMHDAYTFTHCSLYTHAPAKQHSWVLCKRAINLSVSHVESAQLTVLWKKGARHSHTYCSDSHQTYAPSNPLSQHVP